MIFDVRDGYGFAVSLYVGRHLPTHVGTDSRYSHQRYHKVSCHSHLRQLRLVHERPVCPENSGGNDPRRSNN